MDRLTNQGDIYIPTFTRLEIVRGIRENEREKTFILLDLVYTVSMDVLIADFAGSMIMTWRKRGINPGNVDTIIAATALHIDIPLVTTSPRHIPMPELSIC
jgi:predicted nucleic acid-binding protein